MKIRKALIIIKGYCNKHLSCSSCPLSYYRQSSCLVNKEIPADWDVDEMLKERRGDLDEQDC